MKNDWGQSACYRLFLRWHFRLWQRNLLICFIAWSTVFILVISLGLVRMHWRGVGVTTSLVILISSFSAIVGGGGAPLAAIALGQGDRSRAGKILGNGFILLILFTLFTSLIAYTFMEPILLFTGASENTLEYAVNYLSIYLLGTIFVEISTGLNSFINAQGRPAIAMYSVLIGALLNIVLDPIFIFWLDMGVKGAALATVLSQACSAVWVLTFLFSRHASLPLEKRYMALNREIILSIFALGVSPFIMASTEAWLALF